MYLWKYWRESRITFAVGMALVGLLLWGVLKIHVGTVMQDPNGGGQIKDNQIYLLIAAGLTLPFAFFSLKFGSFGVGRDLGEGSGSFLFSRPRSRAFFVWSDWGYGMAQLLLVAVAANLVLARATTWAKAAARFSSAGPAAAPSLCGATGATAWRNCCWSRLRRTWYWRWRST